MGWYGRSERQLDINSGTAIWYHPGKQVPIRWVLVRDVADEFEPQGFLCTDLEADPLDILRYFVRRWSMEGTFAEVPSGSRPSGSGWIGRSAARETLLHGLALIAGQGLIGVSGNPVHDRKLSAVPFKHHAAHRHHIPKPRYRVTNWSEYDAALRQRGSLTVWFTDAAITAWQAEPRTTPGGQPQYSRLAITTGRLLRRAQHRVRGFFWPMRISS